MVQDGGLMLSAAIVVDVENSSGSTSVPIEMLNIK